MCEVATSQRRTPVDPGTFVGRRGVMPMGTPESMQGFLMQEA